MTPYQQKKQNRRTVISFLAAFLFHLLIAGGILLYDYLFVEDLSDFSGPVLVKLGEPEGEDIPVLPEEYPLQEEVPEDSSSPSEASDVPDSSVETPSVPEPEPVSDTAELPAADDPVKTPENETVQDSTPQESPLETQPQQVTQAEPQPKVVEGSEAGNSWETVYATDGNVGRSFGAEIYLYMPVPQYISMDLFNKVKGDSYSPGTSRQDFLMRFYQELNGELSLQYDPVTDDVRAIWDYLTKAGYDLENAEYKEGGFLRPVVLTFTIPAGGGDVYDVKVQQGGSGNSKVDQAVVEGFKTATFYNTENREIKGRFTYRFY